MQQNILEKLNIADCRIDVAFTRTSIQLLELVKDKYSVADICLACFSNINSNLGVTYPEDLKKNLSNARSVKQFFIILSNHPTHWSWINIGVMEKIASLDDQAIKVIEYYKAVMYGKKLMDILSEICISDLKINEEFHCRVEKTWNKPVVDITLKDVQDHKLCDGEIFGINKSPILLVDTLKSILAIKGNSTHLVYHMYHAMWYHKVLCSYKARGRTYDIMIIV